MWWWRNGSWWAINFKLPHTYKQSHDCNHAHTVHSDITTDTHRVFSFPAMSSAFLISKAFYKVDQKTHSLGIFQPWVHSDQNQLAAYGNTSMYKFAQNNSIRWRTLNRRGHITISAFTGGMWFQRASRCPAAEHVWLTADVRTRARADCRPVNQSHKPPPFQMDKK